MSVIPLQQTSFESNRYTAIRLTTYDADSAVNTDPGLYVVETTVSILLPKVVFGGFQGTLKDIRMFSGSVARERSTFSDCALSLGASYIRNVPNEAVTHVNNSFCVICASKLLYPEKGICTDTCDVQYASDSETHTCRFIGILQTTSLSVGCYAGCSSCYAYDSQTCVTCDNSGSFSFDSYNAACVTACPTGFVSVSSGGSSSSRYVCVPLETQLLTATLKNESETNLTVTFSSPIGLIQDTLNNNTVLVTMTYLNNPDNFTYTVELINATTIFINVTYTQSVPARFITVTFKDPSVIKTANGITLDSNYHILQLSAPNSYFLPVEENVKIDDIRNTVIILLCCALVFAFLFIYTGNAWIIWSIIDVFQLLNYLLYCNFDFPPNIYTVFDLLGIFNLRFIPSVLSIDTFPNQEPPPTLPIFQTTSFLYNGAKYIILYIAMILAFLISYCLTLIKWKDNIFKKKIMKAHLIVKIIVLRLYLFTYLELAMMFQVQINNPDFENQWNILSFALAVFFAIGSTIFLLLIMWSVQKRFGERSEVNAESSVMDLLEEYDLSTVIGRNFAFFLLIRKILTVPILLYLFQYPVYQMGLMINLTLNVSLWIVVEKIYKKLFYLVVNLVFEFGILAIYVIMFFLKVLEQFSTSTTSTDDMEESIGWAVVYIVISIISIFIFFGALFSCNLMYRLIVYLRARNAKREVTTHTTTEGDALADRTARNILLGDIELTNTELQKAAKMLDYAGESPVSPKKEKRSKTTNKK